MPEPLVLIVDDEEGIRESLSDILSDEGFRVAAESSAEEGLRFIKNSMPDLVFMDIWLSGMDGVEALEEIRGMSEDLPVIMISGHGNIELAVKATKIGAYDFLEKPLSLDRVVLAANRALERKRLEDENRELRDMLSERRTLVGGSPAIKELIEKVNLAAASSSRVLITGESGSGKELVAHMLHDRSSRARMPFVEVNCAAIPQELIESELFGHEKGSFTGAFEQKQGKFELANHGTLFLDEIGDMTMQTQAKVLRVIETQEFQRVGGSRNIKVDTRIIAATNKDLVAEIEEGRFRQDLFYRLNVIMLEVPPLRRRKEDIPLLIDHFLDRIAGEHGQPKKEIAASAVESLGAQDWPGNVRELKNAVERMVIMTPSNRIEEAPPVDRVPACDDYFAATDLREAKESFERDFIERKLQENRWNISRTAEMLGIERSNLHRKIKNYGIREP